MDISINLVGFYTIMSFFSIFIILGIISLFKGINYGIFIGIMSLVLGSFTMVILDYTAEITNKYEPSETRILSDEYGAIVEFRDKKFEIDDIKSYESVNDSSFYIEEVTYYNFFGSENKIKYNFKLNSKSNSQ